MTKDKIARIMKKHMKTFRKIKIPRRNDKQALSVLTRRRRLYHEILTKQTGCILMDDDTYQYADFGQTRGPEFYTTNKRLGVADKFKFKALEKFSQKYLIGKASAPAG